MRSFPPEVLSLERVFNADVETCKYCGGHITIIAFIKVPVVIEKTLRRRAREDATVALRSPPSRGRSFG